MKRVRERKKTAQKKGGRARHKERGGTSKRTVTAVVAARHAISAIESRPEVTFNITLSRYIAPVGIAEMTVRISVTLVGLCNGTVASIFRRVSVSKDVKMFEARGHLNVVVGS